MSRSRPTTPLRRVSRGSISALSNSQNRGSVSKDSSSTPLNFLSSAMSDLADETSLLQSNLEAVENIQNALQTFDESFAMFLYGLKMNAFCVEWPERPDEESFMRAKEREDKLASLRPSVSSNIPRPSAGSLFNGAGDTGGMNDGPSGMADQTYMTQDDDDADLLDRKPTAAPKTTSRLPQQQPLKSALKPALKKPSSSATNTATASKTTAGGKAGAAPPAKGRITLAQKKKREGYASEIIETLPLEYRGSDPKPRQLAQSVIMALIAAGNRGIRINEIVKMPELPQAKVNKALIALVSAKHVVKHSDNGIVYQLDPSRHPTLP